MKKAGGAKLTNAIIIAVSALIVVARIVLARHIPEFTLIMLMLGGIILTVAGLTLLIIPARFSAHLGGNTLLARALGFVIVYEILLLVVIALQYRAISLVRP